MTLDKKRAKEAQLLKKLAQQNLPLVARKVSVKNE